ncbi:MAG: DUF4190 domain-containing protein [Planctomycetota bacterium]|jgi:hypothetical protein
MTQPVRRLKANKLFEGQRCGWSHQPLVFGEDIVVCNACETPYKAPLWRSRGGCALSSCENAPLQQLEPPSHAPPAQVQHGHPQPAQAMRAHQHAAPPPGQPHATTAAQAAYLAAQRDRSGFPAVAPRPRRAGLPVERVQCIHCARHIKIGSTVCPYCRRAQTADGIYQGPQVNAPGAVASLVCGILGFFICGLILGIVAITKAQEAKRAIAADPRYTGGGMATAGMVLGIVDLVGFAVHMLIAFGGS